MSADVTVYVYETDETTPIDVSDRCVRVSVIRGRRNGLDSFEAGTCAIEFRNDDGAFDPWDTGGAYYADIGPGARVFLSVAPGGVSRNLFAGRVESWTPGYAIDGTSIVRLDCVDGFAELAGVGLGEWLPGQQSVGARITALLGRPEMAEFTWSTSIEDGATTAGAWLVEDGTSAVSLLQQLVRSEQGFMFMSRGGVFTFKGRYSTSATSNLEFRSTGAATNPKVTVPFQRIAGSQSYSDLYNRVVSAVDNSAVVSINEDAASMAAVRRAITYTATDLLCATDNQADDIGKLVLDRYASSEFRVSQVDVL